MSEIMDEKKMLKAEPRIVQGWPSPQDYNEAVQHPVTCFSDPSLQQAEAELNFIGIPKTASGNFASVYHLISLQSDWAVRCFLHPHADQELRYKLISEKFSQLNASYLTHL